MTERNKKVSNPIAEYTEHGIILKTKQDTEGGDNASRNHIKKTIKLK